MLMSPPKQIIGLLGGTFDPVHNGHLAIATKLLQKIPFTTIQLIPCRYSANKKSPSTTRDNRLQLLKIALQYCSNTVEINTTELYRPGTSYTIDTLKILRSQHPDASLNLIIGTDVLMTLNQWLHWHTILDYCHLIIIDRPGHQIKANDWLSSYLEKNQSLNDSGLLEHTHGLIYRLDLETPFLSSSMIREQIKHGKPIDNYLPPGIIEYINAHQLYCQP